MSKAMSEAETKLYFCLNCQKVATMALIRTGGHRGHILTEFAGTQHQDDGERSLMRRFREKIEAAKRYKDLWLKKGL